ncbi:polyamine oxidase 1-like [Dendronephthya gigantea]|uniref:polyamine oxidase 1-like n=1 Tax=Dendronephthya gigantea TaxID=151771 RepID=UPI00106AB909|nr:polyamine oxidase 1-like [Dendronephthya gigantea]
MNIHVKIFVLFCIVLALQPAVVKTKKSRFVQHSNVLILGAGMSGIKAAETLYDNGIEDFTILEGYERIGGRMRKQEFAGTIIELGANWVQGLKNNPIWELAKKYDLQGNCTIAEPVNEHYIIRDEHGKNVTDQGNPEGMAKASDLLHKIVQERRQAGMRDIDVQTGLRLAGWQPQNPAQTSMEYFYEDFDAAERPHFTSSKVKTFTNGSIDSVDGKQFFVFDPRGYAVIVEEIAKRFLGPNDSRLHLKQIVNSIKWDSNGVEVSTTTGEVYTANYLLVTFSIGVLKSNMVKFTPDLPPKILEPIYKIEMADYIKIFLKFPRKFWDPKQYILYASERRGYYPVWQDLEIDAGIPEAGLNILIVTVTGDEASRVQYQSDETTKAEIMAVLRNVYGKDIPDPTDFFYPRWHHDPLFFGCYSNNPIGISHEDFLALQSNISRIYFAGEATNELYNGFVHGAYFSGMNRAEKMVDDIRANGHQTSFINPNTPDLIH